MRSRSNELIFIRKLLGQFVSGQWQSLYALT